MSILADAAIEVEVRGTEAFTHSRADAIADQLQRARERNPRPLCMRQ
jgi:hypothetical protein